MIEFKEDLKPGTVLVLTKDITSFHNSIDVDKKIKKGQIILIKRPHVLDTDNNYTRIEEMEYDYNPLVLKEDLIGSKELTSQKSNRGIIKRSITYDHDLLVIFPFRDKYPGDIVNVRELPSPYDFLDHLDLLEYHDPDVIKNLYKEYNKEISKGEKKEISKEELSIDDLDKIQIKNNKIFKENG